MNSDTQSSMIMLWPDGAPGTESWTHEEYEEVAPPPANFRLVRDVAQPTLTVFLPPPAIANGTGVIVCPGGGLQVLAVEHEGTEVARWLNQRGIAAFMLKYRVIPTQAEASQPASTSDMIERLKRLRREHGPIAVADGQQAVRIVRERADEWGVAPDRVGMLGFSAGGFVAASVALANAPDSRLDFVAPIYGALWENVAVPADAPPFFTALATDDEIAAEPCIALYSAWRAAGRSAEIHIYAQGGHGFGMRAQGLPADGWIDRFAEWLAAQGILEEQRPRA
jgi:acetyl esterase/lipase